MLRRDVPTTITVNGFGTVQTPPDRATVTLSIIARNQDVAAAQAEAAEITAKVLALAEELEIPTNRVDTMSALVQPEYRWNRETEEQELRGFMATRQMQVEIHDLEQVGVFVERAVEEGVNQVSPPALTSSRRRDAYRDALERAVEDARANAERLARALGVSLGDAIQVNAGSAPFVPPPVFAAGRATAVMAEAAPETYNAADMTVSASVNIVFALE